MHFSSRQAASRSCNETASWGETRAYAEAFAAGFRVVRELGHTPTPASLGTLSRLPTPVVTGLLWTMSRSQMLRDLVKLGPAEARMRIDQMTAAAPGRTAALLAIRP